MQVIPVNGDPYLSLSGVELDPVNNMLYAAVTTSFNGPAPAPARSTASCSSSTRSPGQQVGDDHAARSITSNYGCYYPYGFSIASDGTFWIPQPNSENIIHLDAERQRARQLLDGGR